ncbi:MAG: hypothetical protein LBE21_04610 [Pseudomonadales bacterium]|nr:hypothetical protein [Pseudomonadales bacterium]
MNKLIAVILAATLPTLALGNEEAAAPQPVVKPVVSLFDLSDKEISELNALLGDYQAGRDVLNAAYKARVEELIGMQATVVTGLVSK